VACLSYDLAAITSPIDRKSLGTMDPNVKVMFEEIHRCSVRRSGRLSPSTSHSRWTPPPLDLSQSTQLKMNLVAGTLRPNLPQRAAVQHADDVSSPTLEVFASFPALEVVASSPALEVVAPFPTVAAAESDVPPPLTRLHPGGTWPTQNIQVLSPPSIPRVLRLLQATADNRQLFLTSSDSEASTPMRRASPLVSLTLRILAAATKSGAGSAGQMTAAPPPWSRARSCAGMWLLVAGTSSSPSAQRLSTSSSSTRHGRQTSCFSGGDGGGPGGRPSHRHEDRSRPDAAGHLHRPHYLQLQTPPPAATALL
jgi:hypothetical protein